MTLESAAASHRLAGAADTTADVATAGAGDLADPRSLDDVVSIHCYGRSGSVFLASLFDQHPQVLMIPGVQLSSFYEFWRRRGHLPYWREDGRQEPRLLQLL